MEEKFGFGKTVVGMFKGIVKPGEYVNTAKKTAWKYVHLLIIIVSIVLPAAVFFIPACITVGNDRLAEEIDDRLAYFSISEDGFYCEKEYEWISEEASYIRIDSSEESMEDDEIEELLEEGHYSTMVIANSQEILMYSDDETSIITWESVYNNLKEVEERDVYDKASIVNTIKEYDTPVLIIVYIVLVLICILFYYIAGIIWGLIGAVIKKAVKAENEIEMSDLLKTVMLIRTPWFVLVTVLVTAVFKGLFLSSFLLGILIELNYLLLALNSLKNETNINKKEKSEAL